ncbi:hypothetical protein K3495_g15050 [Podosphaera aphanis]|nr:hypothetical protein K3495_g15050 [Podosphaera aphanis]
MSPPSNNLRSTGKKPSGTESNDSPEPSLAEILAELRNISLQQASLSERMNKLELVVTSSSAEFSREPHIKENYDDVKGREKVEIPNLDSKPEMDNKKSFINSRPAGYLESEQRVI